MENRVIEDLEIERLVRRRGQYRWDMMVFHTKLVAVVLLHLKYTLKEEATRFADGLDVEWEINRIWQISKCFWLGLEEWNQMNGDGEVIGSAYLDVAGGNVEFVVEHKFEKSIRPLSWYLSRSDKYIWNAEEGSGLEIQILRSLALSIWS